MMIFDNLRFKEVHGKYSRKFFVSRPNSRNVWSKASRCESCVCHTLLPSPPPKPIHLALAPILIPCLLAAISALLICLTIFLATRRLGKPKKNKKPPAVKKVKPYKGTPKAKSETSKPPVTNPVKKTSAPPTVADRVKSKLPPNLAKARAAAVAKKKLAKQ